MLTVSSSAQLVQRKMGSMMDLIKKATCSVSNSQGTK